MFRNHDACPLHNMVNALRKTDGLTNQSTMAGTIDDCRKQFVDIITRQPRPFKWGGARVPYSSHTGHTRASETHDGLLTHDCRRQAEDFPGQCFHGRWPKPRRLALHLSLPLPTDPYILWVFRGEYTFTAYLRWASITRGCRSSQVQCFPFFILILLL